MPRRRRSQLGQEERFPPSRLSGRYPFRKRPLVVDDYEDVGSWVGLRACAHRQTEYPYRRPPSFFHLGNCPNSGQFVAGLIVGSGGTNAAFATASAASGGPRRLRTRASWDGQYRSPRISQPKQRAR